MFNNSRIIAQLSYERDRLLGAIHAPNTELSYGYTWSLFSAWCKLMGSSALPATEETVSLYLTDMLSQGNKVSTAAHRAAGIASRHRAADLPSPVTAAVRALLRSAQRIRCEQPRRMKPLTPAHLRAIAEQLHRENTSAAARDHAILVVGLASALRRSDL